MNHDEKNSKPDVQAYIDPELEARVVAWVAGEASPFEIAEAAIQPAAWILDLLGNLVKPQERFLDQLLRHHPPRDQADGEPQQAAFLRGEQRRHVVPRGFVGCHGKRDHRLRTGR